MMKNQNYKKLLVSIFLIILLISISTVSFATLAGMKPQASQGTQEIKGMASTIIGVIQLVAVAVAVIMLVVLAIKYISSAPSEKADLKKSFIIYAVGAVILFGGAGLLGIIEDMAKDVNNKLASSSDYVVLQENLDIKLS